MQLKLKIGEQDTVLIDVQPMDTFQDLTERLYKEGLNVDLSQLSSNSDKPFSMSDNVTEYFTVKTQNKSTSSPSIVKHKVCRLCTEPIIIGVNFIFDQRDENHILLAEKVNAALPINVTTKDPLPKQICNSCLAQINKSYDFMNKVLDAQKTLDKSFNQESDLKSKLKDDCCPLCTLGHLRTVHKRPNILRKGPIRKEDIVAKAKSETKKDASEDDSEYITDDEVVTGFFPLGNNLGRKYKKRIKTEDDDQDWTIDEEYVPVSKRGRPKGTRNRPKIRKVVVEKSCVLCEWNGADVDIFAHTINQHCQPDLGYFPCPLCRTNHTNEMVLETHIDKHNLQTRKLMGARANIVS